MLRSMQILLATLLCPLLAAQQTAAPLQTQAVVLPKGTMVEFYLLESISSATAKKGQIVRLVIAKEVAVNGVIVIPEGAAAEGKVDSVRKGIPGKYDGMIDVLATSLVLRTGQKLHLTQRNPAEGWCGYGGQCLMYITPFVLYVSVYTLLHRSDRDRSGKDMTLSACSRTYAFISKKAILHRADLSAIQLSDPTITSPRCAPAN